MIFDVLTGLARANLAAAAAIVVVALLRKPARRAFGARAAYGLWIAPVLAAGACLVPPASAPAPLMAPMVLEAVAVAGGAVEASVSAAPSLPSVVFALWIVGVVAAAALLLWRQGRFMAAIRRREAGPAVVGAFRPRIVTPGDFETRFAPAEREVILAHEGAHLRAGDARINALAAAALCACWFNPAVHIAVYLMRLDQELACDAAVLGRFPQARRLYAEVLLKTQLATQPLPFGCHWPAAAEHPLKERIVMLKTPLPVPARRWAGVAAVALLSAVGAAAAWAAQPGQPKPAVLAQAAVAAVPATLATEATPAVAATDAQTEAAATPAVEMTYTEARRIAGADGEILCKPGTDWNRGHCRVVQGKTWAEVATAADIAREYPPAAKAAGLKAVVMLQCTPDRATRRLADCDAVRITPVDSPAPSGAMNAAFEEAAIRVAGRYLFARPPEPPKTQGKPFFMTIDFSDHPQLAGGPLPPAPAGPGPHGPVLAVLPDWILRPDGADVMRFYPAAAAAAKQEGRATISCRVDGEGRLAKCQLINEAPVGAGFGDAALVLADRFQMKPVDKNGMPTAGQDVRIPFKFALPGGRVIAADTPPPAAEVIVSRREANVVAAAQDIPMVLVKAGRREDAVMRGVVFAATGVTLVRPSGETTAAKDVYRWTHQAFVQRTLCVTSITGQFLCAAPQSEAVGDGEAGSAPADPTNPAAFAEADVAAERLLARLRTRAAALFDTDRKTRLDPLLKAAGVTIAPPARAAPARKR